MSGSTKGGGDDPPDSLIVRETPNHEFLPTPLTNTHTLTHLYTHKHTHSHTYTHTHQATANEWSQIKQNIMLQDSKHIKILAYSKAFLLITIWTFISGPP